MGCGSSRAIEEPRTATSQQGVQTSPSQSTPAPTQPRRAASRSQDSPRISYEQPDTSTRASTGSRTKAEPSGSELREATEKPMIIFVIGGPGCGKGTQCKKIVEKYGGGCRHLSTGELLRAEAQKGSELGKKLKATMNSGALVSDDQVIEVLEKEINESAWFGMAFLVDGFPRKVSQAKAFEQRVRPCDLVLYFDCPEKVMLERLTARGKASGRSDDNAKTIKERLKSFKKQTLPVVDLYAADGTLHRISAEPEAEQVFAEVEKILDEKFGEESMVTEKARSESSEWRVPQVIDIENRFYGDIQKQAQA